VVSTLDLTQIVTVPIRFDPTVLPLPPVDIDATLDPSAGINQPALEDQERRLRRRGLGGPGEKISCT
jgi:hypothetical protein